MEKVAERTDVRRPAHKTLRGELAHDYGRTHEQPVRHDTLRDLVAIAAWLGRCRRTEGDEFLRSMPQAFRGIGWATTGNVKRDRALFRSRLARRLDMLVEMGWLDGWEPRLAGNGVGRGILVRVGRDSSVGRAHLPTTRRMARRGTFFSGRVVPPLREKSPCNVVQGPLVEEKPSGRARPARGGDHAATWRAVRALERASEKGGRAVLATAPWLADLPPAVLTRAAVIHHAPQPGAGWAKHYRLSMSQRSRLSIEASTAQLDRYDGRGAGAAAIIDLAAGGWRQHTPTGRPPRFLEPRTPGLLAKGLRQRARLARRAAQLADMRYAAESSPGGSTRDAMTSASSCGAICAA